MLVAAKTLWKLWTRLSRNYVLKGVVKISWVPFDRFCSNPWGTLRKLWTHLSRNYVLKKVIEISRVPFNRLYSNLQGLCKKILSSKPGEHVWKKMSSFYLQKKVKIFKKNSNACHLQKRTPLGSLLWLFLNND